MKQNIPHIFFLLLLFLVSAAFFGVIGDYLLALFWATILAILFYRIYSRLRRRLGDKPNLASLLTLLLIITMVITPLIWIGSQIVKQGIEVYAQVESGEIDVNGMIAAVEANLPMIDGYLQQVGTSLADVRENLAGIAATASQRIARLAIGFTQNLFSFLLQFFVMLYVLYFFLRDGKRMVEQLIYVMPLGDEHERRLLLKFRSVAQATVKGSLVVALVQGTIGGVLFWAVGIPAPALWGVVMTVLSLLPIGSGLVWVPAAIILFLQGEVTEAIVIVVVGSLLIGLVDNFLRPRLVGQDTKLPDWLILVSTLGGLGMFGISGFAIGPIIAAFFVVVWQMMGENYTDVEISTVPGEPITVAVPIAPPPASPVVTTAPLPPEPNTSDDHPTG